MLALTFTDMAKGHRRTRHMSARLYIKEWREHLGLTQEGVAEKLGVRPATISRYENYDPEDPQGRAISVPQLMALADAYGISPVDLYRPPEQPSLDALLVKHPHAPADAAVAILNGWLSTLPKSD